MLSPSPRPWRRAALLLTAVSCLLASLVALPGHAAANPWAKRVVGYLTTPDGTELRYSVLLPKSTGRFPVVMNYNGYDAGSIGGSSYEVGDTWMSSEFDAALLKSGYAVMGLSMRGTACSTGRFDLFSKHWGPDGALGVEWAAKQPWSTGHVGMANWSWPGLSQLFTAAERPKHLDAIAPGMVVTDPLRDVGAPGGVPNPEFNNLWWATIMASWQYAAQSALTEGDTTCLSRLATNVALGQATSPSADATHLFYDEFWKQRDLRSATARINIPVLSMTDWQDEEVGARGGYYLDLLDPKKTWLVGTNGQHDIYLSKEFRKTLLPFFDRFLKGKTNGFDKVPHVQLWMDTSAAGGPQSSDEQLTESKPSWVVTAKSLPLPVTATRMFLDGSGELRTKKAATETSTTYAPLPGPLVNNDIVSAFAGSDGGPFGEETWTHAPDVPLGQVAFATPRMTKPLTVAGSASLDLWLSSTAPETDIQVTVTELRADGYEQYLQRGWLRASQRAIEPKLSTPLRPVHQQTLASVTPLTPGQLTELRVEIPPFAHTFRTGSKLQIRIDGPSGTGDWNFLSAPLGLNTIALGGAHASSILLGVLKDAPAPKPYAPCNTLPGEPCRAAKKA